MIDVFISLAQTLVDPNQVNVPKPEASGSQIQLALRVVFGIIGAISVLMVVLGGLSYVLSSGDPQKTAKAKDTILYALIGLAVAVMASVIVTFVLGRL